METLKDSRTIVTIVNTAALLAVALYFHKQLQLMKEQSTTQSIALAATIKKIPEVQLIEKHIQQLATAIKNINGVLSAYGTETRNLKGVIEFQQNQIAEMQVYIKKQGGNISFEQPMYGMNRPQVPSQPYYQPTGHNQPNRPVHNGGRSQPLQPQQEPLLNFDPSLMNDEETEDIRAPSRNSNSTSASSKRNGDLADLGL
jgi:uncharacterized protein (UPF0335 family)